jgi:aubergine
MLFKLNNCIFQRYNLRVSSTVQPMLVSRAKAREIRVGASETIYLVPELCRMTGLTDAQRSNLTLMRALADHTRVAPGPRIEKLLKFLERLRSQPEIVKELKQWDMEVANMLIEFSGRILPQETIASGGNAKYSSGNDADWTRELRSKPMLYSPDLPIWVVMYPITCKNTVQSFVGMLVKAASGMSWRIPQPKLYPLNNDRPATYLEGLESVINNIKPFFIMCVVSNNKADRYAAIKKKCCVDRAVPTQVILARNLDSKRSMSIATKIIIQMNCKLGGAPWSVHIPLNGCMVIGYDVCHDSTNKAKSYGALCASLDKQFSRYFSVATAHTNGEELSNTFALNVVIACKKYQAHNDGRLPDRIIIYRDGVGDGQLPYVFEHEVNMVKSRLSGIYSVNPVKLTFIVVSKRINTRIFWKNKNPPPGTVVDDVITLAVR